MALNHLSGELVSCGGVGFGSPLFQADAVFKGNCMLKMLLAASPQ